MANILTVSIVITSVALVLAQYMEAHSKSIVGESKERLNCLKTKLDDIVEKVKSDAEGFIQELRSMTDEWDNLNSVEPDTAVGTKVRALLFVVFAIFVLLHPGVSLSGGYVTLGDKMMQVVDKITDLLDAIPETLLIAQIVLVVAVFWLGGSLWRMVRSAEKYSRRVDDLEGKISPYWKMVP